MTPRRPRKLKRQSRPEEGLGPMLKGKLFLGHKRSDMERNAVAETLEQVSREESERNKLRAFCASPENLFNAHDSWEWYVTSDGCKLVYREKSRSDTGDHVWLAATADDVIDEARRDLGVPENGWMARTGQWEAPRP